ncbi:MAG TPA: hypothetical protein VFX84_00430 [Candidatus Saccharimonadales bacterium]|nr:hypothetical protein [Candidatus Saccharimonadales bacterium]
MSAEAPIHPVDTMPVGYEPVDSLPADFFDSAVAVARRPVGGPEAGTVIDFMNEGYAIEKNPEPLATLVAPGPSPEDVLDSIAGSPDPDGESPTPRFQPYERHMEDQGPDSTLATGITLVSEQGIVRPVLTEADTAEAETPRPAGEAAASRGKNLLTALRRSRAGQLAAVTAIATGELLSLGTSSAQGADDQLQQECVQAGLKHPKILKKGIKHAGQVGYGSEPDQLVFLVARYGNMPEECNGEYMRSSAAKAQLFVRGKWRNIHPGWYGLQRVVINPGPDTKTVDSQDAHSGTFYDSAGIHDKPWQLRPCRARILLRDYVYVPKPLPPEYADEPWKFKNPPVAHKTYKIGIPPKNIYPHSFRRKNC